MFPAKYHTCEGDLKKNIDMHLCEVLVWSINSSESRSKKTWHCVTRGVATWGELFTPDWCLSQTGVSGCFSLSEPSNSSLRCHLRFIPISIDPLFDIFVSSILPLKHSGKCDLMICPSGHTSLLPCIIRFSTSPPVLIHVNFSFPLIFVIFAKIVLPRW